MKVVKFYILFRSSPLANHLKMEDIADWIGSGASKTGIFEAETTSDTFISMLFL